jgi:hypothetical protein
MPVIALLQLDGDGWHVTITQGTVAYLNVRGIADLALAEHLVATWRDAQGQPVPCIIEIGVEDPVG